MVAFTKRTAHGVVCRTIQLSQGGRSIQPARDQLRHLRDSDFNMWLRILGCFAVFGVSFLAVSNPVFCQPAPNSAGQNAPSEAPHPPSETSQSGAQPADDVSKSIWNQD